MGVERFFSSVKKDFDIIINTTKPYKKIDGRYLLIDFNSIVHVLSAHMISTVNNYIINKKTNCPFRYTSNKDFEKDLLKEINNYILDLLKNNVESENITTIYIAIDGVPTMAKIAEQKKRRYMGSLISHFVKEVESPFGWVKNNISPGTNFMNDLQKNLKSEELLSSIKKICVNLENYIVSDTSSPGEGEMKIIDYIKDKIKESKYNIIVYSPDSDMIILLMLLDKRLTILRYDQQNSKLDDRMNGKIYNILDVNKFIDVLLNHITNRSDTINIYKRNVINDIIFIFTIFGDDFLPKLESFRVNTDIFIILDYYLVNYIQAGYLLEKLNNKIRIRTKSLHNFFKLLSKQELLFLKRNSNNHIYSNFFKVENDIFGTQMYKFREMFNEYLWKFIYLNKDKAKCSSPNLSNINKCFTINQFQDFINKSEDSINKSEIEKFAQKKFRYIDNPILNKMKEIFNNNYLYIIKLTNNKQLYDFVLDNDLISFRENNRQILFKSYREMYYLIDKKENIFFDFINMMFLKDTLPIKVSYLQNHKQLNKSEYSSSDSYHSMKLKTLSKNKALMYKIDYKLDEYFNILNPKDEFYSKYFLSGYPDRTDINKYYKLNFNDSPVQSVINEYLLGLNWVVNYYFNNIVDKTWSYPFGKSPLLFDIINNFNIEILKLNKQDKYSDAEFMTPLEQIIFISPINLNQPIFNQIDFLNNILSNDDLNKLVKFIKSNSKYFFDLDSIFKELKNKKLIDCSTSIFVNKCHLLFLEKEINFDNYLEDFRKIFPLKYQRTYYPLKL